MRGERIKATVFLESEDGRKRTFPDWLTKFNLEKFFKEYPEGKTKNGHSVKFCYDGFSWVFYSNEVKYGYRDPVHNITGTLYDCQNTSIGKNELYVFKLEKILYQETYSPIIDKRLQQLTTAKNRIHEIESEIEKIANDPDELDFSEKIRVLIAELNSLLIQHPNIEGEIERLLRLTQETESKNKIIVMYINIYSNNKKRNFFAQEILVYKIWPFPILQWLD